MTIWNDLVPRPAWSPDGVAGVESAASDPAPAAAPESVLFPGEVSTRDESAVSHDPSVDTTTPTNDVSADSETDSEDKKDEADPLDAVPEDGNYNLQMPEGVEIDKDLAATLAPEFKELGLTHRQAQKLVDKYIEAQQKKNQAVAEKYATIVGEWLDKAKNDPEIGGPNWEASKANALRAVSKFVTPELREHWERTGDGNHPEVIRLMARVGAMIREDNPASGGTEGAGKPVDPAYLLFPSDAPKG